MEVNKVKINLYFDGASKNNPGIAGCGYFIEISNGKIFNGYNFLGTATNNEAEYQGIINGIKFLEKYRNEIGNIEEITVKGDSKLVIEQMKGNWKVKASNLIPLWKEANILIKKFNKVNFVHIDRSLNYIADGLANIAIKNQASS